MDPSFCTAHCFGSRFLPDHIVRDCCYTGDLYLKDSTSLTNLMHLVSKSAASADHSLNFLISMVLDSSIVSWADHLREFSRAWLLGPCDLHFLLTSWFRWILSLTFVLLYILKFYVFFTADQNLFSSSRESCCLGQAHDWFNTWIIMISAIAACHSKCSSSTELLNSLQ